MSEREQPDLWRRLVDGKPLDGLASRDPRGRFDLRGLMVGELQTKRMRPFDLFLARELTGQTVIRGAHWQSIDFSGSDLRNVVIQDSHIDNCVFDGCRCDGWRVWSSEFTSSSFGATSLRGASLGGVSRGKLRCVYRDVVFDGSDMRLGACAAAVFEGCSFRDVRIENVDFQSSVFEDCSFSGLLQSVAFYRLDPTQDGFPPNEMKNVDFRGATLREVEFRGLDLADVILPDDDVHLRIASPGEAIDRLLSAYSAVPDSLGRGIVGYFGVIRRWLGPKQVQLVLNRQELAEEFGSEGALRIENILKADS